MEFKQLELKQDGSRLKRAIHSKHLRKTALAVLIGAGVGFLYFYLTEGKNMTEITSADVWSSALIGGFLGFFVTNSPCARGRC